jgi:hypothetical protein
MYIVIVSGVVQEGAVWPLHPAYDILLQEGAGVWIHIVSDVVQQGAVSIARHIKYITVRRVAGEGRPHHMNLYRVSDGVEEGAVWPLQLVYDIIRSDGLHHERAGHSIWI